MKLVLALALLTATLPAFANADGTCSYVTVLPSGPLHLADAHAGDGCGAGATVYACQPTTTHHETGWSCQEIGGTSQAASTPCFFATCQPLPVDCAWQDEGVAPWASYHWTSCFGGDLTACTMVTYQNPVSPKPGRVVCTEWTTVALP